MTGHLGDHITSALDDDTFTITNTQFLDTTFVYQGGVGDDNTAAEYGLQFGNRVTRPVRPVSDNIEDLGLYLEQQGTCERLPNWVPDQ